MRPSSVGYIFRADRSNGGQPRQRSRLPMRWPTTAGESCMSPLCRRETSEFDRANEGANLLQKRYYSISVKSASDYQTYRNALRPAMIELAERHESACGDNGMSATYLERDTLLLQWMDIIAGNMYAGSSLRFTHLDAALMGIPDVPADKGGAAWRAHGGGFCQARKFLVVPDRLREEFIWHRRCTYTTWISEFTLAVSAACMCAAIRILASSTAGGRGVPGLRRSRSWRSSKRATRCAMRGSSSRPRLEPRRMALCSIRPRSPCSTAPRSVTALSRRAPGRPLSNVFETTHAEREVRARRSAGS